MFHFVHVVDNAVQTFVNNLPLGRELWGEADVVLAVGTRLFYGFTQWGIDEELAIIRVDADPEEPERFARPAGALILPLRMNVC